MTEALWALFFGCLVVTAALIPLVMRLARRIDAVDRGGYRKVFQGAMPLLGGLGIAIPLVGLGFLGGAVGHLTILNDLWKWPLIQLFGMSAIAYIVALIDNMEVVAFSLP